MQFVIFKIKNGAVLAANILGKEIEIHFVFSFELTAFRFADLWLSPPLVFINIYYFCRFDNHLIIPSSSSATMYNAKAAQVLHIDPARELVFTGQFSDIVVVVCVVFEGICSSKRLFSRSFH